MGPDPADELAGRSSCADYVLKPAALAALLFTRSRELWDSGWLVRVVTFLAAAFARQLPARPGGRDAAVQAASSLVRLVRSG